VDEFVVCGETVRASCCNTHHISFVGDKIDLGKFEKPKPSAKMLGKFIWEGKQTL